MPHRAILTAAALAFTLLLTACSARSPLSGPDPFEIAGEASYSESIVLPPGCTFRAYVTDETAVPPRVVANHETVGGQAPPFVFSFLVKSTNVQLSHRNTLRTAILAPGDRTLYLSKPIVVLAGGAPSTGLEIMLNPMR